MVYLTSRQSYDSTWFYSLFVELHFYVSILRSCVSPPSFISPTSLTLNSMSCSPLLINCSLPMSILCQEPQYLCSSLRRIAFLTFSCECITNYHLASISFNMVLQLCNNLDKVKHPMDMGILLDMNFDFTTTQEAKQYTERADLHKRKKKKNRHIGKANIQKKQQNNIEKISKQWAFVIVQP